MKISAKVLCKLSSASGWETSNRLSNIKCIIPAFFGDRFVEREGGMHIHNLSAEEVEGLHAVLYIESENFELGQTYEIKLKILKHIGTFEDLTKSSSFFNYITLRPI
jgi:hypothetical protein